LWDFFKPSLAGGFSLSTILAQPRMYFSREQLVLDLLDQKR